MSGISCDMWCMAFVVACSLWNVERQAWNVAGQLVCGMWCIAFGVTCCVFRVAWHVAGSWCVACGV